MKRLPPVSLLLPNYNNGHTLQRVLDRLADNTTYSNVELVAVDDGSTDGSRDILRRARDSGRFERFELIEKENTGAIDSLNAALHAASGDLCVQLDADATVETRGWVERMVDLMLLDEAVGVVTAKIVFDSGKLHACGVNVVGAAGWHERGTLVAERAGERLWLNRVLRPYEGGGGETESRVAEVDSGIGTCMMYRRADALQVGGYDPRWSPVWFDDVDLCMSIRALGRKAFFLPEVRVIHHFRTRRGDRTLRRRLRPSNLVRVSIKYGSRAMPRRPKARLERRFDIDLEGNFSPAECARLRRHHANWREKWGWDALNPDMSAILRRWGHTEICWASDERRRVAGERIARGHEKRRES